MDESYIIKQNVLMIRNIELFLSPGNNRCKNDLFNRIREDILLQLYHPPEDYIIDNEFGVKWQAMSAKWRLFLKTLCNEEYDDVQVVKIANRKQYDLKINYLKNNNIIHTELGEFKHNCKSISKLPQYYSAPEKKKYISTNYAEYFYDNYLDKLCELATIPKIEKEVYLKHIYQHKYSVNPFFESLKELETNFYKEKQSISKDSIKTYLDLYGKDIDIELVKKDIFDQKNKTFILWDLHNFRADKIHPEELEITKFEKIEKNNTIVLSSKTGTRHNMLLRWRNHLGVLYPAWQISLQR